MSLPDNKITCFLIDDDKDDQEIFMLALEDMDINVSCITANDGNEALLKFAQDETFLPNFIFLDLNMPRINGKQCLIEIKKIDHLKDVPVIIYSTSSAQKDKVETEMLGAAAFITKPSSISEFTKILANYLIDKNN
jgi:CheY-like chemotaxis protein